MRAATRVGLAAVVALASLASACAKNEAAVAAKRMADAVCACKDAACAERETARGKAQLERVKNSKGTAADVDAITRAGERARECRARLEAAAPAAK